MSVLILLVIILAAGVVGGIVNLAKHPDAPESFRNR
jgi:hypothetical protein